jgi:hypothetical protein
VNATFYRLYAPDELGSDGYPPEWHETIKHEVRAAASDRCVRCGHPYTTGAHGTGEWTPCDTGCTHRGPIRVEEVGLVEDSPPRLWLRDGLAVEAHWRILTVHHLNGNKDDCRWWNLAALDQRCHLEIQGRVKLAQVYPFEHSDWFKPYAAGWYAHSYLGEDLTRDEVDARLDELLALERVA